MIGVYDEGSCRTKEERKRLGDLADEMIECWEEEEKL